MEPDVIDRRFQEMLPMFEEQFNEWLKSPPAVKDIPYVYGDAIVGGVLTSTMGNWYKADNATYAYQWKADESTDLGTGPTYTATAADAGKSITCVVTATNEFGEAEAPPSNAVTVAAAAGQSPQAAPAPGMAPQRPVPPPPPPTPVAPQRAAQDAAVARPAAISTARAFAPPTRPTPPQPQPAANVAAASVAAASTATRDHERAGPPSARPVAASGAPVAPATAPAGPPTARAGQVAPQPVQRPAAPTRRE